MAKHALIGLLTIAIVLAGIFYTLRRGAHAQSGELPELLSLAPAASYRLGYIDVNSLRNSPFMAQLVSLAPEPRTDPEYTEFVRATGFDYTRDLDHLLLAWWPSSPNPTTAAIAEGRFDREKILSYALRVGRTERQNGVDVYIIPAKTPDKTISLAFLSNSRIAMVTGSRMDPILAAGAQSALEPGIRERLPRVAGAAFFAVGRVGLLPHDLPTGVSSDQFTTLMRTLQWFTVAGRSEGTRLKVAVEGESNSEENANQIAGSLDGLRLFGQVALANPRTRQRLGPDTTALFETLLRAIEVTRDHERVRLVAEFTPQMLNALARANASGKSTRSQP